MNSEFSSFSIFRFFQNFDIFSQSSSREAVAAVAAAADAVADADVLLFCTGAGMGVDSGLGSFRGKAARWSPLCTALAMDYTEMSGAGWFKTDPRLAWAYWGACYRTFVTLWPLLALSGVLGLWVVAVCVGCMCLRPPYLRVEGEREPVVEVAVT